MRETPGSGSSRLQDILGGGLTVAFGLGTLITAAGYPMGSLLRMGPGLFPCILAVIIMLLGVALLATGIRSRVKESGVNINYRSLVAIGSGIVLFALSLTRFGLIPATLALVLVSSLAEPKWRPVRALILALCMTAFVYVIFIVVLRTPIAVMRI